MMSRPSPRLGHGKTPSPTLFWSRGAHAAGMGAGNSVPCQVGNSAFLLDGALLGAAGDKSV